MDGTSQVESDFYYSEALPYTKPHVPSPLDESTGVFNTPISLFPSAREYSHGDHQSQLKTHQLHHHVEGAAEIFASPLDKGPLVGHVAGAFAILWFNSWDDIMSVVQGKMPISTIAIADKFTCFMRYMNFVLHSARINHHTVMVALLYLCRLKIMHKSPTKVSPTSEARILITSLMIADKHEDDVSYTSATWAKLGNISLGEVKKMELEFLIAIKFNLHISSQSWADFNRFVQLALFPLVNTIILPQVA